MICRVRRRGGPVEAQSGGLTWFEKSGRRSKQSVHDVYHMLLIGYYAIK